MENKKMTIDVIIAVYNGERFIADSISSVQRQSWKNLKVIVVDDGSSDSTMEVVKEMSKSDDRIVLFRQAHLGVSAALNLGLAHSASPFVALLDADDLWDEQKLKKQMVAMEKQPEQNICFTHIREFESFKSVHDKANFSARSLPMKGYAKTTFLARRLVFEKYGNFDTEIATGDFIEWYSRALRYEGKDGLMLDEVLAFRRVHANNTTRTIDKNAYLPILKAHIDAKRNNS